MVCERYSNSLSEVAVGGAAPQGFDAHLAGCARCQADLARLRQMLVIADQQMRQLSAIEPAAGFAARLRVAVIESGTAPSWRANWLWPALATAATLVVALIVVFADRSRDETVAATTRQPPAPATAQVSEPAAAPEVARVTADERPARPQRPRKPRHRATREPQVLVPAGESRRLVEFIALVNRQRLVPATLAMAGEPPAPLAAPASIQIKPIEIVPLDTAVHPGT